MKKYIILLQLLLPVLFVMAQTDTVHSAKKSKPSIATVKTMDGKKTTGWFYKIDDEHVYLLPAAKKKFKPFDYKNFDPNMRTVPIEALQLNTVILKKKNAISKWALIGFGSGAVIGTIIGFSSGDDETGWFAKTAEEKAVWGAISGGVIGACTGVIIGSLIRKKFVIGGKKETYRDLQSELMQLAILK